jgi:hypothetical protein
MQAPELVGGYVINIISHNPALIGDVHPPIIFGESD